MAEEPEVDIGPTYEGVRFTLDDVARVMNENGGYEQPSYSKIVDNPPAAPKRSRLRNLVERMIGKGVIVDDLFGNISGWKEGTLVDQSSPVPLSLYVSFMYHYGGGVDNIAVRFRSHPWIPTDSRCTRRVTSVTIYPGAPAGPRLGADTSFTLQVDRFH